MPFFRIETLFNGKWTYDPSLLYHSYSYSDNEFASDLEAANAIDELTAVGICRDVLRVVKID